MTKDTAPKKLTDAEKLAALIALVKANGWTLPDGLDDEAAD